MLRSLACGEQLYVLPGEVLASSCISSMPRRPHKPLPKGPKYPNLGYVEVVHFEIVIVVVGTQRLKCSFFWASYYNPLDKNRSQPSKNYIGASRYIPDMCVFGH